MHGHGKFGWSAGFSMRCLLESRICCVGCSEAGWAALRGRVRSRHQGLPCSLLVPCLLSVYFCSQHGYGIFKWPDGREPGPQGSVFFLTRRVVP